MRLPAFFILDTDGGDNARVAQLVEQWSYTPLVAGSSPAVCIIEIVFSQ